MSDEFGSLEWDSVLGVHSVPFEDPKLFYEIPAAGYVWMQIHGGGITFSEFDLEPPITDIRSGDVITISNAGCGGEYATLTIERDGEDIVTRHRKVPKASVEGAKPA